MIIFDEVPLKEKLMDNNERNHPDKGRQETIDVNNEEKNICNERLIYDPSASIFQNFGEVVCVGATAIIIILLLCILLFFEFKDHDDEA